MNDQNWITTRAAAEILGVSTARIRQLVAEKNLEAKKLGDKYRGQWLINTTSIESRLQKKGKDSTMRVKSRMTRAPITASPKTSFNEAIKLMDNNSIHHLPIINKKGELVGIVTRNDMLRAEPSRVSTLSIYEIAALLDKVTMSQLMSSPVLAINEDCSISEAAHFMVESDIGCLPVTNDDKLIGIITDSDIFKTFIEVTGGGESGTRIEAKLPNIKGQLADFTRVVADAGSWIVSLTLTYEESGEYFYIDIKERGGDENMIRSELDKMGSVENIQFNPFTSNQLLKIG